ncbi:MAG: AAA family ATPase [Labilibaculum sp.]|nr:AAA domain-containing protein [Labilibaculum sp.]MBI9060273.1 AAA family ATPase [Labilibaculum sp.]
MIKKLASYYLDCLSKEAKEDVSEYASNRFGCPEYGQLSSLPQSNFTVGNYNVNCVQNIIQKVRNNHNRLSLQLGYLINLRQITSKNGNTFYVVEPIILSEYNSSALFNGALQLTQEFPTINSKAIENLSGISGSELQNEILSLQEELGFNDNFAQVPDLLEVSKKLKEIRPNWNWIEPDLDSVTTDNLQSLTTPGIYNSAALFYTEQSKFTKGLEYELNQLKSINFGNDDSSLTPWFSENFPDSSTNNSILLEPMPLNDEQRQAVNKSLVEKLTVISGPPGTGKSQVVTSIIVNAVYNKKKVLFASKNHKAVDVVNERVNGLANAPVILKLGNDQTQVALSQHLSNLLTTNVTNIDSNNLNFTIEKHNSLSNKKTNIDSLIEKLVSNRNEIDMIEQKIEAYRTFFGGEKVSIIRNWDKTKLDNINGFIKVIEKTLKEAESSNQSFFIKLFWFFLRKKRFHNAQSKFISFENYFTLLKVEVPNIKLNQESFSTYLNCFNQFKNNIDKAEEINKYFSLLKKLGEQDLFNLSKELIKLEQAISDNSVELWQNYLKVLPSTLSSSDRTNIGDYVAQLALVMQSPNNQPNFWSRFYSLQEKMTTILSCWSVTSLSVKGKIPLQSSFFDIVVIDEASQCDIASALPLLYRAKHAVILGDSKQLSHISNIIQDSQLLEKHNLTNTPRWSYVGSSLFNLAQSICPRENIIVLRDHHRSHADIINFSNKEFYNENLRIATNYDNLKQIPDEPVLRWIDVQGIVTHPNTGGVFNIQEANRVIEELNRLVQLNYRGSIGVVSPFREQANKIKQLINADTVLSAQLQIRNFLCDTVHRFQGDERDLIIFSPVISEGIRFGPLSFLKKTGNLFNVAITRAKAALVIIGDRNKCHNSNISYLTNFTDYITEIELNKIDDSTNPNTIISEWEIILSDALNREGIKTIPQLQVEKYSLDLALQTDRKKLDIEVDGVMYHRDWNGEHVTRDKLRNKRMIELGWDVMRFWVYEIRDDIDGCVDRIKTWKNLNE